MVDSPHFGRANLYILTVSITYDSSSLCPIFHSLYDTHIHSSRSHNLKVRLHC